MSYVKAGSAWLALCAFLAPAADAYELQVMPRLVEGPTVRYHDATAYRHAVSASVRAINRADAGVRLVRVKSRRDADIRIGYLSAGCRGTKRGEAFRGEIAIARGCGRAAARHAVLHELGHALGLDHEDSRCSVMNSWWVDGKPRHCRRFSWRSPLQRDDVAGLRAIWRGSTPLPRPRIGVRSLVVRAGEPVDFVDATSGAGGWVAEWSFGDGTTAAGPAARHAFDRPGTYLVRLQLTVDGRAAAVSELVTVIP